MNKVIILFTNHKWNVGAWFIRKFTRSQFSHVSLCFMDGPIGAHGSGGVQFENLNKLIESATAYEFLSVSADYNKVRAFALDQIGKPYDFKAIINFGLQRDWREDDSWFCSELVAAALEEGGSRLVRRDAYTVSPQDLYQSPLTYEIDDKLCINISDLYQNALK